MTPRILVIAGSDSGGGAGIQADLKTVTMLGGHAMTAITAVTAQNSHGIHAIHPVPTAVVIAQIDAALDDLGADAVKIGMIGSAETAGAVADRLSAVDVPIILDPVMVATSGAVLSDAATIAALDRLMALATIVTPNLPELEILDARGGPAGDGAAPGSALARRTGAAVLVKGGHRAGDIVVDRLVMPAGDIHDWQAPRIVTRATHGTGCTLASAVATWLARGTTLVDAVARARTFVRIALQDAPDFRTGHDAPGVGNGPMGHQRVRLDTGPGARLNQITLPGGDAAASRRFYETLGLRSIVTTDDGHYTRFEAICGTTLSIEQGARPTIFLEHEALDAEVARLQECGMMFDALPADKSWRWREARLTDPAGNAVCLFQAGEDRRFPPWRR